MAGALAPPQVDACPLPWLILVDLADPASVNGIGCIRHLSMLLVRAANPHDFCDNEQSKSGRYYTANERQHDAGDPTRPIRDKSKYKLEEHVENDQRPVLFPDGARH